MIPLTVNRNPRRPPPGWRWELLTDLARLESGHTPSRRHPEWWGGDTPWLALPDIRAVDCKVIAETTETINDGGLANSSARVLPAGTVALSRTASVGFVTLLGRPMATSQDFVCWVCGPDLEPRFLMHLLRASRGYIRGLASGAIHKTVYVPTVKAFRVCVPALTEQHRLAAMLDEQMDAAARMRAAADGLTHLLDDMIDANLRHSLAGSRVREVQLAECIVEVKKGVGVGWREYPVLGVTRSGVASAKESVGKYPERYKLVDPGTVFYNPMRILLGSIGLVDMKDATGITSPDYVVIKAVDGKLHHRWFYWWLRSGRGAEFIKSLTRGAVRERMLFQRLASGSVRLPPWESQVETAGAMLRIAEARHQVAAQSLSMDALPAAFLGRAFSAVD